MKRTFNYTGRKRIDRDDVSIVLSQVGDSWVFDATLSLSNYSFPRNAEIWVEAYRQNLWMQWSWGTITLQQAPFDRRLTDFDDSEGVLFRVRVVQPKGPEHHKLVGEASAIPFVRAGEANDRRRKLLVTIPHPLDQQLWKIDFDADPPTLLVNSDAKPSWKSMVQSTQFEALVYPEILRRMMSHILVETEWSPEDEPDWRSEWMEFAFNLVGDGNLPDSTEKSDRERWIQDTVSALCRKLQYQASWNRVFDGDKST
jgi:hypothetical protein